MDAPGLLSCCTIETNNTKKLNPWLNPVNFEFLIDSSRPMLHGLSMPHYVFKDTPRSMQSIGEV